MNTDGLYKIISSLEIDDILDILSSYEDIIGQVGPIRNDMSRDKKTGQYKMSNRKIVILDNIIYERLRQVNLDTKTNFDFMIKPYEINENNYPPVDSTSSLYFSNVKDNLKIATKRLSYLEKRGLLKLGTYSLIPKNKDCLIIFDDSVTIINRIIIKTILDDPEDFRVSWCKKKLYNLLVLKK